MTDHVYELIRNSYTAEGILKPDIPLLNLQTLQELKNLEDEDPENRGFLRRLITIYQTNAPDVITSLGQALAGNQGAQIKQWSHKLKGLGLNLGAQRLAILCETLELYHDNLTDSPAQDPLRQIQETYQQTIEALLQD